MKKEKFELLKSKYGYHSSFAVWKDKDNINDLSVFNDDKIIDELNEKYILVALNPAKRKESINHKIRFKNFHDDDKYQKDFKLCYALEGTVLWGSYITDLYKSFETKDGGELRKELKNQEKTKDIKNDMFSFLDELSIINPNCTLVAIGSFVYEKLLRLSKEHGLHNAIIKITHYAYRFRGMSNKDNYRNSVLTTIGCLK